MSRPVYFNGLPLFLHVNEVGVPDLPVVETWSETGELTQDLARLDACFLSSPWNASAEPSALQAIHWRWREDGRGRETLIAELHRLAGDRGEMMKWLFATDAHATDPSDAAFVQRHFFRLFGRGITPQLREDFLQRLQQSGYRRVDLLWELMDFHRQFYADPKVPWSDLPRTLVYALAELHFTAGRYAEGDAAVRAVSAVLQDLRLDDTIYRARWYGDHGLPPADQVGRELQEVFCDKPFGEYHVMYGGETTHCCNEWLPLKIGSIFEVDSAEAVYNGPLTRRIRAAIQDGSYRYCAKEKCRFIRYRELPTKAKVAKDPNYTAIIAEGSSEAPERFENIYLDYDQSCNLSCPSCRDRLINARPAERKAYDDATEAHIKPLLKRTRRMSTSGYGDPFASPTFRQLLQDLNEDDFPGLTVNLMTNGLLITPERWKDYTNLNGRVSSISVSIDAASAETYAVVRRGGDFNKLVENLAFMRELREAGHIAWFQINFVTQQRNFREMPDFVRLGHRFECSLINFQQLYYWPTGHTEAEFREWAVHLPDHPEHAEFCEVLREPLLSDVQVVHDFHHLVPPRPWPLASQEGLRNAFGEMRENCWTFLPELGSVYTGIAHYPRFLQARTQQWLEYEEGSLHPKVFRPLETAATPG